jgi:hypothetical protein
VVLAAVAQDGEAFKLAPDAGPSQVKAETGQQQFDDLMTFDRG